jgi:aspartyl-tRNA(Asn)/glutamyl-tRNA(Gln) amidotransferase subunit B
VEQLRLPAHDAAVLTADPALAALYERCVATVGDAKKVSNWFLGELSRLLNASGTSASQVRFSPAQFAALLAAVDAGTITAGSAKVAFAVVFETGRDPAAVIAELGLALAQDRGEVERLVDEVLAANPRNVEGYRAGNQKLLGFFVGQVLKALKGRGDPKVVSDLLTKRLG